MTKEELEKETAEYFKSICGDYNEEYERTGKRHYWVGFDIKNAYLAGAEPRERRIAELEEKISILLSCKNCPDNKGGYICEKEYEGKCLSQKTQYIKELQEENAELKNQVSFLEDNLRVARKDRENLQLDVAKGLKEFVKDYPATAFRYLANDKYVEQLTYAKTIIQNLLDNSDEYASQRAIDFLKEE